jgi:hypothetical protein
MSYWRNEEDKQRILRCAHCAGDAFGFEHTDTNATCSLCGMVIDDVSFGVNYYDVLMKPARPVEGIACIARKRRRIGTPAVATR